LGNADAYRVTREIPLPYRRVDNDTEDDDDKGPARSAFSIHLDRIRRGLVGDGKGRGPDALSLGPRGGVLTREYEARRPTDPGQAGLRSRMSLAGEEDV
jgi:hypothetical protein